MRNVRMVVLVLSLGALMLTGAQAAGAESVAATGSVVFVQTNESAGNRVVVYDVAAGGGLTRVGTYATGGRGGVASPGNESDHLASQSSLVYDAAHRLLIAVNAGSNTVSTFAVDGDRLRLTGVVSSGGDFPSSVSAHGELVYVLNAGGVGSVAGFKVVAGALQPLPGSVRSLGLANTSPPDFLTSPGQVGFTPSGAQLVVTTKASGSNVDVFQVLGDGRLSAAPVRNASAIPVPFAFTFTPTGRVAVGEAGTSNVTTYGVRPDGTLVEPKTQTDHQTALCWILRVGDFYYVSNTGNNTLGGFRIAANGQPSLLTPTGVSATTEPGPIDLTSPSGTRFLYAQTGSGKINEFAVGADGTLTRIGVVRDLPVGMEGIAST